MSGANETGTGTRIRVASVEDIESGSARQVVVGDTKVALVRVEDDFYAVNDRCTHANYSLSEGEVDCDDRTLECWKHGALFSLTNGEALTLPAIAAVQCYEVEVTEGEVFVSLPAPSEKNA